MGRSEQAAGPAPRTDLGVVCVIVTHRRPALLERALDAITSARAVPDHIVVVDNDPDPHVRRVVEQARVPATYLPSRTNLGGAGGFAYGILAARAMGAGWVWLADDDGRPDEWTLSRLLLCAEQHRLGVVSPLVLDEADPTRLCFPLRRGVTWARTKRDLHGVLLVPGVANLFNGALFSAAALDAVGVPDSRLFVRGDEVEIHRRLARSGVPFGTCVAAHYLHPGGQDDWRPLLGGRLGVLVPDDPGRRDLTFRNLGYLTAQPGLRWRRLPDEARYAWFYLGRGDVEGWRHWRDMSARGRRERFGSR